MFKDNTEKYLYRRQYLLSPHPVDGFGNWKQIHVFENHFLTTHPDLPVIETHRQNKSIYLLGYIIDPYNPSFDDAQIMQDVIVKSINADDIFNQISDKCGRYVIIAKVRNDCRIFSDTCGMRQVFFHVDSDKQVWCSSQPHLIADQLHIDLNEFVRSDLHKTSVFKSSDHWYPGKLTLFDKIFHLTPNHYFDLDSMSAIRYWPREPLIPISMSECVPKVLELLSGIIEGAVKRFNLAFAISNGLDSRVLLAASRKVAEHIQYFTHTPQSASDNDINVFIPSSLLSQLGLKHSALARPEKLDTDFEDILNKNVFTARLVKGFNAFAIYNHFKNEEKEIVVMYGNCSEISKRDRFRFPKTPQFMISGTALAAMGQMSHSKIAINEFKRWLTPVKNLTKYNIDILDLMHWEQRVGNWAAMTFTEYEMVFETLCPFSCRRYIEYMLGVPFKYRTKPDYKMHHEIMKAIWPAVLEYEINPIKNGLKKRVEDFLYQTFLYDPIKFLHIMFYKRFK